MSEGDHVVPPPTERQTGFMNTDPSVTEEALLERALQAARDTRRLAVGPGIRHDVASAFTATFGDPPAVIVADERTYAAAGADVRESFRRAGHACEETFLFGPDLYAEHSFVERLQEALATSRAIPVAVGSGTINDLTKLVAHRLGRPYLVVATAASMDGYTAYGASITYRGSKQTFDCPAPRAVLADLDVIAQAPRGMNAAGYADLFAKGVAGADWILADAAGVEPIDRAVWSTVQDFLPSWVDSPGGVARAEPACLRRLVVGLMMSGFAMQAARTSRPASGADHQFSHLWDMQHHAHNGAAPSHGFKVGIGTLASLELYEVLLRRDLDRLDIDAALARWPVVGAGRAADSHAPRDRRTRREGDRGDAGQIAGPRRIAGTARTPSRRLARDSRAIDSAPAIVPSGPGNAPRGRLSIRAGRDRDLPGAITPEL